MEVSANDNRSVAAHVGAAADLDFSFLPSSLLAQCQSLIESYHELHGYACLPDVLWKSRLGPFIEAHREFRQLLRKASTTRSAKKSNEGFVRIAKTILSLEILASSFAGWSAIYPNEGSTARSILQRHARSPQTPLMEFYLYPPKYISSAAIAALAPPTIRQPNDSELYRKSQPELSGEKSQPELSGEKQALNYVSAIQQGQDGRLPLPSATSAA